jgi:hypothetical protein
VGTEAERGEKRAEKRQPILGRGEREALAEFISAAWL